MRLDERGTEKRPEYSLSDIFDIIDTKEKQQRLMYATIAPAIEGGMENVQNDCIGRKVRRIYDNGTEADGRIMAYLPANPKKEIQNIGSWFMMV